MTTSDAAGSGTNCVPRARSPFVAEARLPRVDAERMLEAVSQIARRAASASGAASCLRLGPLEDLARATLGRTGPGTRVATTTFAASDGLDLVAGLLECADALAGRGWSVAALALEGVEARLLEALLDAGTLAAGVPGDAVR